MARQEAILIGIASHQIKSLVHSGLFFVYAFAKISPHEPFFRKQVAVTKSRA
jgi:hypothetical protein